MVSLVVIIVLLISIGTYFSLRYFLGQRLDQQLQTTISQGQNQLFEPDRMQTTASPLRVFAVALSPRNGSVLYSPHPTEALAPIKLDDSTRKEVVARSAGDSLTLETTNGEEIRATLRTGSVTEDDGVIVPAVLLIGLSTHDERETLHRLVVLELIIGSAAVVIAAVFTTYGVGFGLRRLRAVTTTAQEVAAELSPEGAGLDRRVPDDEPETEVGQLATSFNTMLAAVETQFAARVESERRMRQFLADASHELRTPLTSIRGYAELARMQRAAGDASDDNIDRIESEGTRMSRLVEDLLTLARGDADGSARVRRELVDLDVVLDDAVSGSRAAFPDRTITLELHSTPAETQVIGDPDQLLRVVRNLVTNAAVHTAPERPIVVHGWREGDEVIVQVADGGPGLNPEDAAHVFERFWRADKARTRARGGSGLGLSIVATIIRAHGGSVRFESTVETGSTVTVVLPSAESGEVGAPL